VLRQAVGVPVRTTTHQSCGFQNVRRHKPRVLRTIPSGVTPAPVNGRSPAAGRGDATSATATVTNLHSSLRTMGCLGKAKEIFWGSAWLPWCACVVSGPPIHLRSVSAAPNCVGRIRGGLRVDSARQKRQTIIHHCVSVVRHGAELYGSGVTRLETDIGSTIVSCFVGRPDRRLCPCCSTWGFSFCSIPSPGGC